MAGLSKGTGLSQSGGLQWQRNLGNAGLGPASPVTSGVSGSVSVTGVSAAVSVGTPTTLATVSIAVAVGSVASSVGTPVTSVLGSASTTVTGVSATSSVGTTTNTFGVRISVTGVSATASVNSAVSVGNNLIVNGTFADSSVWSLTTGGGTSTAVISGGVCVLTGDGANEARVTQLLTSPTAGQAYELSFSEPPDNWLGIRVGSTALNGSMLATAMSAQNDTIFNFTAGATTYVGFYRIGAGPATIDNVVVRAVNITPTAFSFTDVTAQKASTVITSNTITVAGLGASNSAAISITGGTYSKNGGAYTSAAGRVVNGDTVAIRVTSSAASVTATTATLTIGTVSDTWSVTTERRVLGYYIGAHGWSGNANYLPAASIDWTTWTHLSAFSCSPNTNGTLDNSYFWDPTNGPATVTALCTAAHAAGRKVLICIGGAGSETGFRGAASSANRATFVSNIIAEMDARGADGVDIDWEQLLTTDYTDWLALLTALRAARPNMLIAIAIAGDHSSNAGQFDATNITFWNNVAAQVDFINLMTYDMSGAYSGWTNWHSSPLYGHTSTHPVDIEFSLTKFSNAGIAPSKLGFGMGFYGSSFGPTVTAPGQSMVGQSRISHPSTSFRQLVPTYIDAGATRTFDTTAKVPYLTVSPTINGISYISYDDSQSIGEKGQYCRDGGWGGVIVWTMGEGYHPTVSARNLHPYIKPAFNP